MLAEQCMATDLMVLERVLLRFMCPAKNTNSASAAAAAAAAYDAEVKAGRHEEQHSRHLHPAPAEYVAVLVLEVAQPLVGLGLQPDPQMHAQCAACSSRYHVACSLLRDFHCRSDVCGIRRSVASCLLCFLIAPQTTYIQQCMHRQHKRERCMTPAAATTTKRSVGKDGNAQALTDGNAQVPA
jgi:hypothetical protein